MSCREIFWHVGTEAGERIVRRLDRVERERPQSQLRVENDTNHGDADKRPQSLTCPDRRASRERNRWYVLRNSCLIADNRWRDSIRLNASLFSRHCHDLALFHH